MKTGPSRRAGIAAFATVSALWVLFAAAFTLMLLTNRDGIMWGYGLPVGRDFNVFWTAANLAADGRVLDIFDRVQFWQLRRELLGRDFPFMGAWLYPPHYLLLLAPLAFVPYLAGYALFTGGTMLAYFAAAWRLGLRRWGLFALATAPATFYAVEYGQNGFLTAALLVPGVMLLTRRPVLAGALFGVLTFKPTVGLLVLVAVLAARAWKAALVAVLVAGVLSAVATIVYGIETWTLLVREPMSDQLDIMTAEDPMNVQIMTSVLPRFAATFGNVAYPVQAASTLFAAAITYRVFRVSTDSATRTLVVMAGTCLATPYLFVYDLPMLALALAWYVQSRETHSSELPLLIALWFLPLVILFGPLVLPALILGGALVQVWWRVEPLRIARRGTATLVGV